MYVSRAVSPLNGSSRGSSDVMLIQSLGSFAGECWILARFLGLDCGGGDANNFWISIFSDWNGVKSQGFPPLEREPPWPDTCWLLPLRIETLQTSPWEKTAPGDASQSDEAKLTPPKRLSA